MIKSSNLQELCSHLGMSKSVFKQAFSELKERGYLFTPAKTVAEFISNEYPVRLAIFGPTSDQRNSLSIGPFAISRKFYEHDFLKLKSHMSSDALGVLMTFKRIEYEKFGAFVDHPTITIQTNDEETFIEVAQMSGVYDLSKPFVYKEFVWFDVKNEFKLEGRSEFDQKKIERKFWWWWALIDFDEGFIPPLPEDKPENYSLLPNWFFEIPKRYLPEIIIHLIPRLFSYLTLGLKIEDLLISVDELTEIINEAFDEYKNQSVQTEAIDRELLIKELCDYNNYIYPVDVHTTLSYLESIAIISTTRMPTIYKLADEFEIPSSFSVTDEWEEKFNKFVETGSVLFGYLSLEEITT